MSSQDLQRLLQVTKSSGASQSSVFGQPQQKIGFLQKAGNVASNILGGAADLLGGGIGKFSSQSGELVGKGIKGLRENKVEPLSFTPEQYAGSGIQAGTEAIAAGTGLGGESAVVKTVSPLVRYGKYAASGATYGGAFGLGSSLSKNADFKQVIRDTLTGAATGATISAVVPAAIEGTVRAVKNIASLYSGVPKDAIEFAFRNPERVQIAVRKYAKDPEQTQEILTKANDSFNQIKTARQEAYQNGLQKLSQDTSITKTGPNAGTLYVRNADNVMVPTKLTQQGIRNFATRSFNETNLQRLPFRDQNAILQLKDLVANWSDITPLGLDTLRARIGNEAGLLSSPEAQRFGYSLQGRIRDYVNARIPQIAELVKNYAKASSFISNLQDEFFGKNRTMKESTVLNRLLTIFNQKSDLRQELLNQLGQKAGTDLLNEIVGAAMASWLPTGWVQRFVLAGGGTGGLVSAATLQNPALAAGIMGGAMTASPRIVGKATRVLGQASRALPLVQKAAPYAIKSAVGIFGPRNQQ